MLMALIFWNVEIDGTLLSRYYDRRCVDIWDDTSAYRALISDVF
jgi:hypothetical protein